MRIVYVANYQGRSLVKNRPCMHNLSLAARVKIQLIAEILRGSSHEVEIISQGALEPLVGADRFRFRFYPAFSESEQFHPDIPIHYTSALAVKFLTGIWESTQAWRLLAARHKARPYDALIIYNLQRAQIGCARHAARRLGLPVILQYEDDAFVNVHGKIAGGLLSKLGRRACRKTLQLVSGGTGVSPYLMLQMPPHVPKVLLRGVVSNEILKHGQEGVVTKQNRVVFSGTHENTQGLEQMVKAWRMLGTPSWELHIAGQGPITPVLQKLAEGDRSIAFHGLLNREENARLLCSAKIGMNPQDLTKTPGNVFPFKMVEYLAAGAHVVTTPRGAFEPELEVGVTYIQDNEPKTIAECLKRLIEGKGFERTAKKEAIQNYGPEAISRSLNKLLIQVTTGQTRGLATSPADVVTPADAR